MKRQNEVLVGILTIVAIATLVLGMYWLSRGSFRGGYDLYTVTTWGQGLKTGQRVLFAGVSIGYVEEVQLRREGTLVIKMIIEDEYEVPRGSTAAIQSVGLFGDMMVAITPLGPSDNYHTAGDTLPQGKSSATPQDIITGADSVTKTVQAIMAGLHRDLIDAGTLTELRNTVVNTNRLVSQIAEIAAVQSKELTSTMAVVRRTVAAVDSASIDSTLRAFQRASSNVEALTAGLEETSAKISALVTKLESGEGTAGKLIADPGLYDDLRGTVGNLNTVLDDFKANPRKYLDFRFSIFGGRKEQ